MVGVAATVVHIDLLVNHVLRSAHFAHQVKGNVFESKPAGDVHGGSAQLVPLKQQLKDIVLAVDYVRIIGWVVLGGFFVEALNDVGELALTDFGEDTCAASKGSFLKLDSDVYFFFLAEVLIVHFEFKC